MNAKRIYVPEDERNFSPEAIRMMLQILQKARVSKAIILLDEPVSNSGRLKTLIADVGEEFPFVLDILIMRDVDRFLYGKERIITSDSVILDHCESGVNLAAECINGKGRQGIRVWSEEKGCTKV